MRDEKVLTFNSLSAQIMVINTGIIYPIGSRLSLILFVGIPERPPDIEAHDIEPGEGGQEAEVGEEPYNETIYYS